MFRGGATSSGNAAITSGSITGTNAPYVLGKSGIPFIMLSSGSVAANGAISGITALPLAYPKAYCYFPANIVATVAAAGWYYCTFSTTTAGVAFLDTYSSGTPAIPSSPTAVTDGKGAFTGDLGPQNAVSFTVPAAALGINGQVRAYCLFSTTSNANSKIGAVKFGGGTWYTHNLTSAVSVNFIAQIANRGAANAQVGNALSIYNGSAGANAVLGSVDTTVAQTVLVTIQRATATDNVILEMFSVDVYN